jgi:protease-4
MKNLLRRFFGFTVVANSLKLSVYMIVAWNVFWFCIFGAVVFLVVLGLLIGGGSSNTATATNKHLDNLQTVFGDNTAADQLLAVQVTDDIVGELPTSGLAASFSNATSGYEVKQTLYEAASRDDIKGVVLEVNSPGGEIFGARAIADGISYYKQKAKKPVYAHVEGLAASGAYWAVAPADKIVADYGSDVGSIGVIMGPFEYYNTVLSQDGGLLGGGVVTQNGIESFNITAGKSKDVGSPYRHLTPDELRQLQQSVNNDYDDFVSYVSDHRRIKPDVLRNQIGAMIYDNKTALSLKLIDASGSREDTFAQLARAAKISGDNFKVVQQTPPVGWLDSLLSSVTHAPTTKAKSVFDTCNLTRTVLAYHGNVADLCKQ